MHSDTDTGAMRQEIAYWLIGTNLTVRVKQNGIVNIKYGTQGFRGRCGLFIDYRAQVTADGGSVGARA